MIDLALIDGSLRVTDDQAAQLARDLAKHEGIFGGVLAGANAAAALELLKQPAKEEPLPLWSAIRGSNI